MDGASANRWSRWAFGVAFLLTIFFFYRVVAPFLMPIILAAFLVVLFDPLHARIVRGMKGRRSLAAMVSSVAVILLLLIPAGVVITLIVLQVIELVQVARDLLGPGGVPELLRGEVPEALEPLVNRIERFVDELEAIGVAPQVQDALNAAAAWLTAQLAGFVPRTASLFLHAFMMVVALYYFFRDGPRILEELSQVTPMERRYEEEFYREFRDVAYAMFYVNLMLALVQGTVGAIGFAIIGMPQVLVWAALLGMFSLLPVIGPWLIWLPVAIVLFITGRWVSGLFLFVYGALVISSIDNVLRPILAKGRIRLHPLLVFVTIFGGIVAFGFVGVLLGPLIGSLFTAMIGIWKRDFVPDTLQPDEPARPS